MIRNVQMVLGALFLVLWSLSKLAHRFPNVSWLQVFYFSWPKLSEEQQARMRRRANISAGIEMILLGIVLPMGYVMLTVMMFNSFTPTATVLVLAGSLLCIVLGITAIVRNRQ